MAVRCPGMCFGLPCVHGNEASETPILGANRRVPMSAASCVSGYQSWIAKDNRNKDLCQHLEPRLLTQSPIVKAKALPDRLLPNFCAKSGVLYPQGLQFNDLEADEARARFDSFVAAWNKGAVPLRFYSGVDGGSLKRTQHSWGMTGVFARLKWGSYLRTCGCVLSLLSPLVVCFKRCFVNLQCVGDCLPLLPR